MRIFSSTYSNLYFEINVLFNISHLKMLHKLKLYTYLCERLRIYIFYSICCMLKCVISFLCMYYVAISFNIHQAKLHKIQAGRRTRRRYIILLHANFFLLLVNSSVHKKGKETRVLFMTVQFKICV